MMPKILTFAKLTELPPDCATCIWKGDWIICPPEMVDRK